jgi:hypothetical protein
VAGERLEVKLPPKKTAIAGSLALQRRGIVTLSLVVHTCAGEALEPEPVLLAASSAIRKQSGSKHLVKN